jgi:hypothetical protein
MGKIQALDAQGAKTNCVNMSIIISGSLRRRSPLTLTPTDSGRLL